MAFPTTGVLDDFNRADVGPPPSANWTDRNSGNKVVSNAIVGSAEGDQYSYWSAATFGPDCEAFVTISTKPTVASAYGGGLGVRMAGATHSGYELYPSNEAGTDKWELDRVDAGVFTTLGAIVSQEFSAGDKSGLEAIGSTLNFYWWSGGTWTLVGTRSDATYGAAGNIQMYGNSTTGGMDNFGGGTIVTTQPSGRLQSGSRSPSFRQPFGLPNSHQRLSPYGFAGVQPPPVLGMALPKWGPSFRRPFGLRLLRPMLPGFSSAGGPTTFLISLTATQAQAGTIFRTVAATRAGTQAQSGTVLRAVAHLLAATQAQSGVALRSVGHPLAGTQAQSGSIVKVFTKVQALAGTQAQAGTVTRQVGVTRSGTQAQSGGITRQITRSFAATQAQLGALARKVAHLLAATQAQAGTVIKGLAFFRTASGTQAQSGAVTRQVGIPRGGTQAQAGALTRSVLHLMAGTQAQAGTVKRTVGVVRAGTQSQAGSVARGVARPLTGTQAQAGSALRAVLRTLTGTQPQAGSVTRTLPRSLSGTQPQAGSLTRQVAHRLAALQAQLGTVIASSTAEVFFTRMFDPANPVARILLANATGSTRSSPTALIFLPPSPHA